MMYKPPKEQLELIDKMRPWIRYTFPGVELRENAPEEIKQLFPKYLEVLEDINKVTSMFD